MSPPGDPLERLEERAARTQLHLRGRRLATVGVRTIRRFVSVRVTGLAAEMTYYTVLSLVPLVTGLGAGLGVLQRFIGRDAVRDIEDAVIDGVAGVLSEDLVADVVGPLVQDLLRQERASVAIGGLLLSLWLASRVFRAAIRALDDSYEVDERRTFVQQWVLSLGFTAGAVVLVVVSLGLVVVGPLLGGGVQIAEWLGVGEAFQWIWAIGRWPVVAAVSIGFLVWLYRAGPNVANTWRECIPGAVLATGLLILVATGFRYYLGLAGPQVPDVATGDEAVALAAQLLGVLAAVLLFIWLSNIVVLLGGLVNAEWARAAPDGSPSDEPDQDEEPAQEPADRPGPDGDDPV